MKKRSRDSRVLYQCSFCGKAQEQVRRLIAGPDGVYICDECIGLCQEIIAKERHLGPAGLPVEQPQQLVAPAGSLSTCFFCSQPIEEDRIWGLHYQETVAGEMRREDMWQCHEACLRHWVPPDAAGSD